MEDFPDAETLLANAVQFLIAGGDIQEATALASCTLKIESNGDSYYSGPHEYNPVYVILYGPREAFDLFQDQSKAYSFDLMDDVVDKMPIKRLERAFKAFEPDLTPISSIRIKAEISSVSANWRDELVSHLKGVSNQGTGYKPSKIWNGLGFRSATEVRIAEALERRGVMFLPNCMSRLGMIGQRKNLEADFLVMNRGKVGILEVDGETFHPPTRTVHDHERDRFFKQHGVRVIEHYDATRCYNRADDVVSEFLGILESS